MIYHQKVDDNLSIFPRENHLEKAFRIAQACGNHKAKVCLFLGFSAISKGLACEMTFDESRNNQGIVGYNPTNVALWEIPI